MNSQRHHGGQSQFMSFSTQRCRGLDASALRGVYERKRERERCSSVIAHHATLEYIEENFKLDELHKGEKVTLCMDYDRLQLICEKGKKYFTGKFKMSKNKQRWEK